MIKYSIVLVPFPFDDFNKSKVRPAVCLTNSIGKFEHVVIDFISSKIPIDLENSELLIEKDSDNWFGTGLTVSSVIKLHKLVSIPKNVIVRRLGFINHDLKQQIFLKLIDLFSLGRE